MVGRFGLYSRRSYEKASQAMHLYEFVRTKQLSLRLEKVTKKKSYRQRMMEAFQKDPFVCPHCQRSMSLVEVWHADYGLLYYYMQDAKTVLKTLEGNVYVK